MTITALVYLVIYLIIVCAVVAVLLWLVDYVATSFGMPARLAQVLKAVIVIVAVLIVIVWLVGILPGPPPVLLE